MKNFKKLIAFSILLSLSFLQMHGSSAQSSQDLEFPQHSTEKYMYNKSVETRKHDSLYTTIFGKHPNGIEVTDKTSEDVLSNRVTRKKIETRTENGVSIITTETWASRNPSYLTWVNGALVISAIAAIVLGATGLNAAGNMGAAYGNAAGNVLAAGVNATGNSGSTFMKLDDQKQEAIFNGFTQALSNPNNFTETFDTAVHNKMNRAKNN